MSAAAILVASNRGPVSFRADADGNLSMSRGGGGLVSGLMSVLAGGEATWVCAALSQADHEAVAGAPGGRIDLAGYDTGGAAVRMLDIEPVTFHRAYNMVANSVLWFVHHLLFATPDRPVFDARFRRQWDAYVEYNQTFAAALAEEAGPHARVMVQDYHLTLVPSMLREIRPDLLISHFSHTPWAPPAYFRLLPDDIAIQLVRGLLAADAVGFHSARWADAFAACCWELDLPELVESTDKEIHHGYRTTRLSVHPLGVDGEDLRERASHADVKSRIEALRASLAGRQAIVRVDRTELSKNIVRGLAAYRELLRIHPEHREKVVHLVHAYPSRHDLPDYREYTAAVQRIAAEIEEEFATPDWSPILLTVDDDYAGSLAALTLADVLVINPIRDGMNLVAKEGPVLAERGCVLILSREAGAADELSQDALMVNPYDVSETAEAMHTALLMDPAERTARSERLATTAVAAAPRRWFSDQLAVLG